MSALRQRTRRVHMSAHLRSTLLVAATFTLAGLGLHQAGAAVPAASFVPYGHPTRAYTHNSCRLDLKKYPIGQAIGVVGPCGNILTLQAEPPARLIHEQVPTTGWETWGTPPAVEKAQPDILTVETYEPLDVRLRRTSIVGGLEIEPKGNESATFTATFYDYEDTRGCLGNVLGTITRTIGGNQGARLFAINANPGFRCIRITSTEGAAYALAEIRMTLHHHHHG